MSVENGTVAQVKNTKASNKTEAVVKEKKPRKPRRTEAYRPEEIVNGIEKLYKQSKVPIDQYLAILRSYLDEAQKISALESELAQAKARVANPQRFQQYTPIGGIQAEIPF